MRAPFCRALLCLLACAQVLFPSPLVSQSSQAPDAPIKIAVMNLQQGVLATKQGQRMALDVQKQFNPLMAKMKTEAAELDALKKQTGDWTAAERESHEATIAQRQKDLDQETQQASDAYNAAMQKWFDSIAGPFSKGAVDYVQRSGFNVLIDSSANDAEVLWTLPSTDVTQPVVDSFDAGGGGAKAPMAIPARIALIDFNQVVFGTDEAKLVQAELQAKYAPEEKDLDARSSEVDRLKRELQAGNFSDEVRASRQSAIDDKEARLKKDSAAAQDRFTAEGQAKLQEIAAKVVDPLKDILTRGGYTILFGQPGTKLSHVLWRAPEVQVDAINSAGGTRVDLSTFAIQAYNAIHPAAVPAQPEVAQARAVPAASAATVTNPVPAAAPVRSPPALENGVYYALVIGINQYPPQVPALQTAVADAKAIGDALHQQYGFIVKTLLDQQATRANILNQITWYRDNLQPQDNLLIYYAGHGYSDPDADKAYWLPVDADSAWSPNRISADDLATEVRVQPARHVLIISDSCYSGDLSRDVGIIPRPGDQEIYLKYLGKMLSSRSRTIMASGGDEPVADNGADGHSVFAYALLQALSETDQSMFTASDLFQQHLKQRVGGGSDQQPRYDIIRNSNHQEGDFVFMRNGVPSSSP